MDKLWAGRAQKQSAALADAFNSSIGFDQRLWPQDIAGSIAHAQMLARCGEKAAAHGIPIELHEADFHPADDGLLQ